MTYTVLARRYRSKRFEDVVGQEAIAKTLQNAIKADRVAHAYLFTGTRGIGKTTMARVFAKALNCTKGPTPEPCCKCDICEAIARGDDIDVIEIDGASNRGIEDIRGIRSNISLQPARARFKIYYIDEVHMLTTPAFNALLKTLEEPPEHVKFIFSTTQPEKMPATVHSRCQRFDFRAVPTGKIADHLAYICKEEKAKADAEALKIIARQGRGSVRDALTLLDQVLAVGEGKVTLDALSLVLGLAPSEHILELLGAVADGDTAKALSTFETLLATGSDMTSLIDQVVRQMRDLLVISVVGPEAELLEPFGPPAAELAKLAERFGPEMLPAAMQVLTDARSRIRRTVDGRALADLAVSRMCRLRGIMALPEVLARLEEIESRLDPEGPVQPPVSTVEDNPGAKRPKSARQAQLPEIVEKAAEIFGGQVIDVRRQID
ncbi:MAG: DNA polymerase III subunit gamma/tau [Planctomycetia bacterium]|nr:DNA polymerase III subunit gamma/tau [Planctomycetia bacterium]